MEEAGDMVMEEAAGDMVLEKAGDMATAGAVGDRIKRKRQPLFLQRRYS